MDDAAHMPLLGAVVCCTSIPPEQRSQLASAVEQMGAVHKFDLTSDVTHLIVGNIDTPKYKFVARERSDVKCLLPTWVDAVRESWIAGGDTLVEALEVEHKVPVFYGLKICVTGFIDERRKFLEQTITQHGGEYKPNLTKEETHLIASEPAGAKFEFATKWGLKIVAFEWLEQSLQRGMVLEVALFSVLTPPKDRGIGAWIRTHSVLGNRERQSEADTSRKLRRSTSAKFERQNSGLWDDIAQQDDQASKKQDRVDSASARAQERPVVQKVASFRNASTRLAEDTFSGRQFVLNGFEERKHGILQRHLVSRGGMVCKEADAEASAFLVVPHTTRMSDISSAIPKEQHVNENWVEKCAYTKTFVNPSESIVYQPFENYPIAGFDNLKISMTGFQGIAKVHASKTIKLMGAVFEDSFDKSASVLICNDQEVSKDKLLHARLWRVPAVKAEWLWKSVLKQRKLPFGEYLVQPVGEEPDKKANGAGLDSTRDSAQTKGNSSKPTNNANRSSSILHKSAKSGTSTKPSSTDLSVPPAEPLREVSPNSSPTRRANSEHPAKKQQQASSGDPRASESIRESLGPAISELLQHQRASSSLKRQQQQQADSTIPAPRRQRRRLLGRAPSSGSNYTPQPIRTDLSRASSVDTVNTDGLGTPIQGIENMCDGAGDAKTQPESNTSTNMPSIAHIAHADSYSNAASDRTSRSSVATSGVVYDTAVLDEECRRQEEAEQQLAMTQLGYEDESMRLYRERLARKVNGESVPAFKGAAKTAPPKRVRERDEGAREGVDGAGLGISRRTRAATSLRP